MLVMEDRRKEVKAILCEELDNLRQRIIENHIRAGQRASGRRVRHAGAAGRAGLLHA